MTYERLQDGDVHLWTIDLSIPDARMLDGMSSVLSTDEWQRAQKFQFPSDRQRSVLSRGALREILSRYIGIHSGEIEFTYSAKGKPTLKLVDPELHFNLAHADHMAVVAVTTGAEVGVDIERLREIPDALELAATLFPISITDALRSLPADGRSEVFLRNWTRTEAWVKATGLGLADYVDGKPRFGNPCVESPPESLFIDSFVPAPGYIGAIAVLRGDCKLQRRSFTFPVLQAASRKPF